MNQTDLLNVSSRRVGTWSRICLNQPTAQVPRASDECNGRSSMDAVGLVFVLNTHTQTHTVVSYLPSNGAAALLQQSLHLLTHSWRSPCVGCGYSSWVVTHEVGGSIPATVLFSLQLWQSCVAYAVSAVHSLWVQHTLISNEPLSQD